jgi:hypothetical protein
MKIQALKSIAIAYNEHVVTINDSPFFGKGKFASRHIRDS